MKYSYSKNLNLDFEKAEEKVRDALLTIGFGVLTEINMRDAFKTKLNLDYRNYKIFKLSDRVDDLLNQAFESI